MGFDTATKEKLAQPLDPSLIKQRQGGSGTTLDYVEGHEVMNLLDALFGPDGWKSEILDSKTIVLGDKVKFEVVTRLYVFDKDGIQITSHDGLGAAAVPLSANPETIEFQSKAAATDSLKRTAIHFGNFFGRHLYDKDDPNRSAGATPASAPQQAAGNPYTRGYAKANGTAPQGQGGTPTNGAPAPVAPDTGEVFTCDECGDQVEGYQSGPRSKYQGQFVTAAQLVSDSRRLKQRTYCYKHYQASFKN